MQVGWPKAKELLLTARVVEAEESLSIGLLNHLVDSSEVMSKSRELAELIVGNNQRMVQGIKALLIDNIGDAWNQTYNNELEAQSGKLTPTPVLEGFKKFIDRNVLLKDLEYEFKEKVQSRVFSIKNLLIDFDIFIL